MKLSNNLAEPKKASVCNPSHHPLERVVVHLRRYSYECTAKVRLADVVICRAWIR